MLCELITYNISVFADSVKLIQVGRQGSYQVAPLSDSCSAKPMLDSYCLVRHTLLLWFDNVLSMVVALCIFFYSHRVWIAQKSSAEIVIVQAVDRYIIIVSVILWCPSL